MLCAQVGLIITAALGAGQTVAASPDEQKRPVVEIEMQILEMVDDLGPEGRLQWDSSQMHFLTDGTMRSVPKSKGADERVPRGQVQIETTERGERPTATAPTPHADAVPLLWWAPDHEVYVRDGRILMPDVEQASQDPPPWKVLAAPRVSVLVGQQASITIGRQVPYMVKREDGSLVVKQLDDVIEGLVLELKATKVLRLAVKFEDIRVKLSRVVGRQAIEGVPFDVGRPTITTQENSFSCLISRSSGFGFFLPTVNPDDPLVCVLLGVRVVEPE